MKNKILKGLPAVSLLALSLLSSCTDTKPSQTNNSTTNAKSLGIDLTNFDKTIRPQDDFYQFVNGNWAKNTPIPATEGRWGSFNELNEKNRAVLVQIINEAAAKTNAAKGSNWQMVGDYYASGMDSVKIEQAGVAPLRSELDAIAAIKDKNGIIETVARFHRSSIPSIFGFFVNNDRKNSTRYAAYMSQGGLGLPERSYYLEENFAEKRKQYVAHIGKMLTLSGENAQSAGQMADQIVALETEFAKVSLDRTSLRDPERSYNKRSLAQLAQMAPAIDFKKYFVGIGANPTEVIVGQPAFFEGVNKLLDTTPLDTWKAYLRWHLIRSAASSLSKAFVDENFDFYGKKLRGIQSMKPRSQRVQESTSGALGEPLGQLYVERAFTPQAKARAEEMIGYIRAAFADHIKNLDWMSATTKEQALKKLNAIVYKIGYPDKWKNYKGLEISRNSYIQNQLNISRYEFERRVKRIGQEVDRSEWFMSPQTVNAYYNSGMNEIVFPAAILQPPFFDANADDPINFGGIGAVIGHELTHGFDDNGSRFDAEGNMKNWWTKEDSTQFAKRTQILVNQFNNYKINDLTVNGKLTLGENIADLGGIAIAYDGLKKSLAKKGLSMKEPLIDGFTPEQRFFINWAQVWRTNFRPQTLQEYIKTDTHSPGMFRANGPLTNMPTFFEAFGVKEGDPMRRPESERAVIW